MSESQPTLFVGYPRGDFHTSTYGTPEKLKALGSAYFELKKIAMINFWGFMALVVSFLFIYPSAVNLIPFIIDLIIYASLVSEVRNLSNGLNWSESKAKRACLLLGLNAFFLCGIFGYIAMEKIIKGEMKRYGVRTTFSGVTKSDFNAGLAKRRQADANLQLRFSSAHEVESG